MKIRAVKMVNLYIVPLKRIHDVFVSHIMYSDLFVNEQLGLNIVT